MSEPEWTVNAVELPGWLEEGTTPPADGRTASERAAELSHQTYGPARENDAAEYQRIMDDLKQSGVQVNFNPDVRLGEGGYGPGSAGSPGTLTVNPDVDISTLGHEYEHFLDDRERDFPGMREFMQNPQLMVDGEMRAWGTEIARAEAGGHTELKAVLEQARQEQIDGLKKRYGM